MKNVLHQAATVFCYFKTLPSPIFCENGYTENTAGSDVNDIQAMPDSVCIVFQLAILCIRQNLAQISYLTLNNSLNLFCIRQATKLKIEFVH